MLRHQCIVNWERTFKVSQVTIELTLQDLQYTGFSGFSYNCVEENILKGERCKQQMSFSIAWDFNRPIKTSVNLIMFSFSEHTDGTWTLLWKYDVLKCHMWAIYFLFVLRSQRFLIWFKNRKQAWNRNVQTIRVVLIVFNWNNEYWNQDTFSSVSALV